jgi:hypothetical protein
MISTRTRAVGMLLSLLVSTGWGVSPDQTDDFQTGTTMGWTGGQNAPLPITSVHVTDGGPTGAGDGYVRIGTDGFHLATYNELQWSGDYVSSGILGIEMDLNHLAPVVEALSMRLMLFGAGGTFASTDLTPLTSPGTWEHHVFSLDPGDLTYVSGGSGDLAETLGNLSKLQIRHDRVIPTPPGSHPPHVTATLGIDNIRAIVLPGDANRDGAVTDADYTIWADNYNASPATWSLGDWNGDNAVTDADYTVWADNYNVTLPIPEPSSLFVLLLSAAASVIRKR